MPTPIFSVEPISTATWPARAAANRRAFSTSVFASVHVPDLLGGDAALHELLPQLVVGVPPVLVRRADIGEHELERPAYRGGLAGQRVEVFVVAGALPDAVNRVGGDVDLARPGRVAGDDHADVERGLASVGGDQEHVVLVGAHLAGGDLLGALGEGGDVLLQLDGRLHRHGGGRAAAVVALHERGHGQVEVVGGLHVGEHRPHPQQLLPVLEAGESGLHAERAAGRRDLHLRDQLTECCRPRIECADRPFALAASAGRGFRSEQHRSFRDRGGHRIRPAVLHETLGAPSSQ
ncbi:hypothetical protein [Microbacterium paulum]